MLHIQLATFTFILLSYFHYNHIAIATIVKFSCLLNIHLHKYNYFYYTDYLVRLVGGSSYSEGRVEVNYNGEWGTVCDNGWDDIDAGVVCRQLGFGSSGTAIVSAFFGQGSGSIWLDSVTCTGSELTLTRCGHVGINSTRSCSHAEDAGVKCNISQGNYKFIDFCISSFVQHT